MAKNLRTVARDFPDASLELWSRDPIKKVFDRVSVKSWQHGFNDLFDVEPSR
jgi:hypothetical protein